MNRLCIAVISIALCVLWCNSAEGTSTVNIIPQPAEIQVNAGEYLLPSPVGVRGTDRNSEVLARGVVSDLTSVGFDASLVKRRQSLSVTLDTSLAEEQYKLSITDKGVTISAATTKGAFYAVQTLSQLASGRRSLPLCEINDYPRLGYRGMMLDVVRCYIPLRDIEKFIDVAARLKINNLHLHLTDDNGWRLEIKKYPRLTEVGAWRVKRDELFPGRLNQRDPSEPTPVGGFYTQDEMRRLVKYAAERHVNIIPEIEMPAHSAAAIASYPELACPVNDKFVGVFPGIGGKDASIIMCAGNDDVYRFYEDVLAEVMDIFPSRYIHLGGDEATKTLWEKCPRCQQRISSERLKDAEELQAYFMDRINHYVRSHGRTAMGWDEVTYGDPKEDMVILGWQGDGGVAVKDSRKSGRKFIMTPAKTTYLIRYQGPQWFEPWTYFGNNRLSDIYCYEPVAADWTPEMECNMIGIQGSLWSEFCENASDMQYLVFPRMLAVADVAWRPKGSADWEGFLAGVDAFMPTLDSLGVAHARSMWNIQHTALPLSDGTVKVTLECERPDVEIRYSLGDSTLANVYSGPITVETETIIYASTFKDGKSQGSLLTLPLMFNAATGRGVTSKTCNNGLVSRLLNGVRGSDRNSDFEWAGWWNAPAQFTIDLGAVTDIRTVTLGTLINSDICVLPPKSIRLFTSIDGVEFLPVAETEVNIPIGETHPARIVDLSVATLDGVPARYLRIEADAAGDIPDGMAREGTRTWMYFDELIVNGR